MHLLNYVIIDLFFAFRSLFGYVVCWEACDTRGGLVCCVLGALPEQNTELQLRLCCPEEPVLTCAPFSGQCNGLGGVSSRPQTWHQPIIFTLCPCGPVWMGTETPQTVGITHNDWKGLGGISWVSITSKKIKKVEFSGQETLLGCASCSCGRAGAPSELLPCCTTTQALKRINNQISKHTTQGR